MWNRSSFLLSVGLSLLLTACPGDPDEGGIRLALPDTADVLDGLDVPPVPDGSRIIHPPIGPGPAWGYLCAPCADSSECGEGGYCGAISSATDTWCQAPCGGGGICPDGYVCDTAGEPANGLCVPEKGRCDCVTESIGQAAGCTTTERVGVCAGWQICQQDLSWSECDAPHAHVETCNGKDDDCDGLIDEDFGADGEYTTFEACGACGVSCADTPAVVNGVVGCVVDSATSAASCGLDHCDPGFFSPDGTTCITGEVPVCLPCTSNAECAGGLCEQLGTETSCTRVCDAALPCPAGTHCTAGVCAPPSGDCSCVAQTAGLWKGCTIETDFGACEGLATCDPTQGWIDCDAPLAAEEICNLADDNCDGEVDEPFKNDDGLYDQLEHCGTCDHTCVGAIPNATAVCDGGTCVVDLCDPGYVATGPGGCAPAFGSLCHGCDSGCGPAAVCVTLDAPVCLSICDAATTCPAGYSCQTVGTASLCMPDSGTCTCTAQSAGQTRPCQLSNPQGLCTGVESCEPSVGWTGCTAAMPAAETCNGSDDNCDGAVDEGLDNIEPCTNSVPGVGACPGLKQCLGAGGLVCDAPEPQVESCNSLDDDCDGVVDDGFKDPATGKYVSVANCGGCGNACGAGPPNATSFCDAAPAVPACAWSCVSGWVDADTEAGNGCECQYLGPNDTPGDGVDQNCDGIDGEVAKAVFVSIAGDDANPGTQTLPLRTLGAGILRATQLGLRDVLATGGTYAELVTLAAGIGLYGGYSEDFSTQDPTTHETVITSGPGVAKGPGVVNALSLPDASLGAEPTVLSHVTVIGPVMTDPSESSYAIYVRDSGSSLIIEHCRVIGGKGGPGPAGEDGTHGIDGVYGAPGQGAHEAVGGCDAADGSVGGVGAVFACEGLPVNGGDGGTSNCPDYNVNLPSSACPPEPYQPVVSTTPGKKGANGQSWGGKGGYAGMDAIIHGNWDGELCVKKPKNCFSCVVTLEDRDGGDGEHGTPGNNGVGGTGCSGQLGKVVGGLWAGSAGVTGGKGDHGGGGGGGGAGGGIENVGCTLDTVGTEDLGGGGGGGGSGGCAGHGGTAGGPGGGAFGLFVVWTAANATTTVPILQDNELIGGAGGPGGAGGAGGTGGFGGPGGKGGANGAGEPMFWCAPKGGYGGIGGHGGAGGGAGGGCGGPSVKIYASGKPSAQMAAWATSNSFVASGAGGAAGPGGPSKGIVGTSGTAGVTLDTNF